MAHIWWDKKDLSIKKSKHISLSYFTSAHLLTDKSLLALHTDPQLAYRP